MKFFLCSAPLLVAVSVFFAHGQTAAFVDAPKPEATSGSSEVAASWSVAPDRAGTVEKTPGLKFSDWAMIGSGAVLRVLDYATTEKAMASPQYFHEDILPSSLVHNKAGFAAFQAGTVIVDFCAYRFLVRHRLRSIAIIGQYAYDSAIGFQVLENYQTLGKVPVR